MAKKKKEQKDNKVYCKDCTKCRFIDNDWHCVLKIKDTISQYSKVDDIKVECEWFTNGIN